MKWIGKHIFGFDAIFRQDVTIDGNLTIAGTTTSLGDSDKIILGDGSDLQLYHDGTNSYLTNATGDLKIINYADDKDIILQSDDGSGGVETYLYLDGSNNIMRAEKQIRFADSAHARFGGSGDLQIYHDASNSYINQVGTGDLYIVNTIDDKDIIFQSDDGSGGVTAYLTLDGSAGFTTAQKSIAFADGMSAFFGTDLDGLVSHSGTNMLISNEIGDLVISNRANDKDIILQSDDGSGGYTPYLTLDGSANYTTAQQEIRFDDAKAAQFGTSGDLVVWHTGTNSEIINYTGDLYIKQTLDDKDIIFQNDDQSGGLATYMIMDGSTGRIGIGTTSPSDKFDVQDGYVRVGYTGGAQMKILPHSSNDGYGFYDANNANADMWFKDGKVGIGTGLGVTPSALLHVAGTVQVGVDDTGHDVKFFGATAGSYMLWDESQDSLEFPDSTYIKLGTGDDFKMWHDGSNTYLSNEGVGHLYFQNTADDKDIIFKSDNGSGGTTTYMTMDGGIASIVVYKDILMANDGTDGNIKFGASQDLILNHDGTDSKITNATGDLYLINNADDKDIILQSDDGSGGTTAYLTLDGSAGRTYADKTIRFNDSVTLEIGNSGDMDIYHNGTNTYIENLTGHLYINNKDDNKDIIFKSDNGSGGITAYFQLDGSHTETVFSEDIRFADSKVAKFGTSSDLQINHNGSHSYIVQGGTGNLYIQNTTDDADIIFTNDDGSGGTATYLTLDGSAAAHNGSFTTAVYTQWGDRSHIAIGGAKDMQLYHDGSNSYIEQIDGATGSLIIQQGVDDGDIIFNCDNGSGGVTAYLTLDGSASLLMAAVPMQIVAAPTTLPLLVLRNSASAGTNDVYMGYNRDGSTGSDGWSTGIDSTTNDFHISEDADTIATDVRMCFEAGGNIGIGTTAPSEKLQIIGGNIRLETTHGYYGSWVQAISSAGLQLGNDDNSGYIFIHNDGNLGVGTATPDTKLEVVGSFAANGPSSTFVTMSSGDTSPDVSTGNIFKTHSDGVTIDQFDGGVCGQTITIISGGATVYDVTSSELKGGTTNITTAAGDVTMWVCESATVWHLISWMDLSIDLSSGGF